MQSALSAPSRDGKSTRPPTTDPACSTTSNCAAVCADKFSQTMCRPCAKREIARIVTLALFEATLRGRADAARYLSTVLDPANDDLEITRAR